MVAAGFFFDCKRIAVTFLLSTIDISTLMSHQIQDQTAKELFELAHSLRKKEPWRDIHQDRFFGICDPESGQIQIVSVLGFNQTVYAVQLYLPDEGIRFWNHILRTGEIDPVLGLHEQKMLECEFCDPENLPDEDIEFYDSYGLPINKPHSLPIFRSTHPHHYPWFLQQDEALLLRNALVLLDKFHSEMLRRLDGFYHLDASSMLPEIPVFHLGANADPRDPSQWQVKKQGFPLAPEKAQPEIPKDELFFNRFHQLPRKDTQWEIASYFFATPLMEEDGDRPYLPYITLCLDPTADIAPVEKFNHADKGLPTIMREAFSAAAENYAYLPRQLNVSSALAADTFADLEEAYGIKVLQSERLPHLERLMPTMIKALSDEFSPQRSEELVETNGYQNSLLFGHDMGGSITSGTSSRAFSPDDYTPPQSKHRYVMRVDLNGCKPPIWRRITLPIDATFFDLHCAIQGAMGWGSMHLHCFDVKNEHANINIQIPNDYSDDWGAPSVNEYHTKLQDIVEQGHRQFYYTYDFGDSWDHKIKIEDTVESESTHPLPTILTGKGACPPEDCGGIWSYYNLLQLDDDELEQHGYTREHIERIRAEKFELKKVHFSDPIDCIRPFD